MARWVIAGFVVVLLATGVIAYAVTRGGSEPKSSSTATTTPSGETPTMTATGGGGPSLPRVGEAVAVNPDPAAPQHEYVVGDIRVRDHRSGDNKPLDIPPNVHPAEGPAIPSTLTHDISQKVKAVVMDCAKQDLPRDARGDGKPRLEGQISIAIKAHT